MSACEGQAETMIEAFISGELSDHAVDSYTTYLGM